MKIINPCPMCRREFEDISDYPVVFMKSFERLELPEFVPGYFKGRDRFVDPSQKSKSHPQLPKRIADLFTDGKTIVSYKRYIYEKYKDFEGRRKLQMYTKSRDETSSLLKIVKSKRVQNCLARLEEMVGKKVAFEQIRNILYEGCHRGSRAMKPLGFRLSARDVPYDGLESPELGIDFVTLKTKNGMGDRELKDYDVYSSSADIARITYKPKLMRVRRRGL